jgi:hypothetical protein
MERGALDSLLGECRDSIRPAISQKTFPLKERWTVFMPDVPVPRLVDWDRRVEKSQTTRHW